MLICLIEGRETPPPFSSPPPFLGEGRTSLPPPSGSATVFANYLWTMFWGSVFWIFWIMWFFSCENTNIDVFHLRMIDDWYWKISACSSPTSYSGSAGWYFQYQSIHIQITYTYRSSDCNKTLISNLVCRAHFWNNIY